MGRPFFPPSKLEDRDQPKRDPKPPKGCPLPRGKKYGFLTVLRRATAVEKAAMKHNHGPCVKVRCECGEELAVRAALLESGNVRSCGKKDHRRKKPEREDGFTSEVAAADAATTALERERAKTLYPSDRMPKPPRESDFAWRTGGWMT